MNKFRCAIHTVSLRWDSLRDVLDACSRAGFQKIEFPIDKVRSSFTGEPDGVELRSMLDRLGLSCIGGHQVALKCSDCPEEIRDNHNLIVSNAKLLNELGASKMVVGIDIGTLDKDRDKLNCVAESLSLVASRTAEYGVRILVEFNWGEIKSILAIAETIRRCGSENVGILFDPAHFHCTPTKSEHLSEEICGMIGHVHVNNMPERAAEFCNCNADRLLPNDPNGVYSLPELFGKLEKSGYEGDYSIEMFSDELWSMPASRAARIMYKSMMHLFERI